MSSVSQSFHESIEAVDFAAINQCMVNCILQKHGHALAKDISQQPSQAIYVSRLLPVLQRWNQEQLAGAGLDRLLTQLRQRTVPASVISILRLGHGLYVCAGCRPSNARVELVVQTCGGRWIHRELNQKPSKFHQNRHAEGLMGFNYGFIGAFRVEDDEAIRQVWINGFSVDIVVQNIEETAFIDQVDDLLHLCRRIDLPLNELPSVLDDGLFAIVCRLRDPLRDRTVWSDLVSQDETIGPSVSEPKMTVVIPLFRSWTLFLQGHFAAFAMDPLFCSGDVELLYLVDDPVIETDVVEWIRNYGSYMPFSIRVVALRRNMGFGMACNIGVQLAHSKYVVLMNSDVFPDSAGWGGVLLNRLQNNVGSLVAPILTYESGCIQHCGMYVAFSGSKKDPIPCNYHVFKGLELSSLFANLDKGDAAEAETLSGAVLAFRRHDFIDLGGFDPIFGRGDYEDLELSFRWKRCSGPILVEALAKLIHLERQTMDGDESDLHSWRGRFNALCAIRLCPEMVAC